MQKDFDGWNKLKKTLDSGLERRYFRDGEIWWVHLGVNVGYEADGKGREFSRPVLVLKKYNKYSFLGLPLTTRKKSHKYTIDMEKYLKKVVYGTASQIKNIDSKRLINRENKITLNELNEIKEKISKVNFC